MCQRPSIIFYWAANNMCSLEFIYWVLLARWSPNWIGKRGSALRGARKFSARGKMAEKYSAAFFFFLCFSAVLIETDCVYEALSLASNSCKVSIVVWWCGEGAESLKEPVAPECAGRRGVHLVVSKGVWQQRHPSRGTHHCKALLVLGVWWEHRACWPFVSGSSYVTLETPGTLP